METSTGTNVQGNTQSVQSGAGVYSGVQGGQLQNGATSSSYGAGATSTLLNGPATGQLNVNGVQSSQPSTSNALQQNTAVSSVDSSNNVLIFVLLFGVVCAVVLLIKYKNKQKSRGDIKDALSATDSNEVPTIDVNNAKEDQPKPATNLSKPKSKNRKSKKRKNRK